jgi:hypothetical protein
MLSLADYPWHMQQFWVRHPDGFLIRPAQRILSVNSATYRCRIAEAFEGDTQPIAQELLPVKEAADQLARQGDMLGAATIYEMLVTETIERSHLYYDFDEARYDDYYEGEEYYEEEEEYFAPNPDCPGRWRHRSSLAETSGDSKEGCIRLQL